MTGDAAPTPGWARATGHASPAPATGDGGVGDALARALVAERIARYGWAYDERHADALADCFTEDGVWEGSLTGTTRIGPHRGRHAVVDFLSGFWAEQHDQRRHVFSNVVVHLEGPARATAVAYLVLTSAADAVVRTVTTGPYHFDLVEEQGTWRLSRLSAGFDAPF